MRDALAFGVGLMMVLAYALIVALWAVGFVLKATLTGQFTRDVKS